MECLSSDKFEPAAWLSTQLLDTSPTRLADLKWSLQQRESETCARFEASASHLKDMIPRLLRDWAAFIESIEEDPACPAAQLKVKIQKAEVKLQDQSMGAFNELIELERRRQACLRMSELVQAEREWRACRADLEASIQSVDLDGAQEYLHTLERLLEAIHTERKAADLDTLRQRLIHIIRTM